MRTLQDRTQSNGDSQLDSDDFNFETSSGWDTVVEYDLDRYIKNKNIISAELCRRADRKVPLSNIIHKHIKNWTEIRSDSTNGWTHTTYCPFPDHKDNNPSFGYNSRDEIFNCFSCHRKGKTVAFLSALQGRPKIEVAISLLSQYGSHEDIIYEMEESQLGKIDELTFQFAKDLRDFKKKFHDNSKSFSYAEEVQRVMNLYIIRNYLTGAVDLETVEELIERLRFQLECFGVEL